jgi:hypothetical protein
MFASVSRVVTAASVAPVVTMSSTSISVPLIVSRRRKTRIRAGRIVREFSAASARPGASSDAESGRGSARNG